VSKQALDQQKLERQAAEELEKRRDQAFADRLLVTEQRVQLMEREVQRSRKDAATSVQVGSDESQTLPRMLPYCQPSKSYTFRNIETKCRQNTCAKNGT
jgi:hypothetical protein